MRIAYIAPYQGPALRAARPSLGNLALAGNLKIELIAELLTRQGHDVEILSQGEVVQRGALYYPPIAEELAASTTVPVRYASSVPVRFVNGRWSSWRLDALFRERHAARPFDLVILYNLKLAQLACGSRALALGVPVVLEYEDDALVDLGGLEGRGVKARLTERAIRSLLAQASGAIGASPFLLTRLPRPVPSLLLRGVVSSEIAGQPAREQMAKENWVTFSGTLFRSKGLEPLIAGWQRARPPGWTLQIAGDGELGSRLHTLAGGDRTIVFHGLLGRTDNAALLLRSKICINPHDLSHTPGNVFAFKIVEYLAAGSHVITTPMGPIEPDLERGITYIADNTPELISQSIREVIANRSFMRTATDAARARYGPAAVAVALDDLVEQVVRARQVRVPDASLAAARHT